jgi:hypothetical protein
MLIKVMEKRMLKALFMCLLISATPAGWAMNKCTGQDNKVVFQDLPCDASAKKDEKIVVQAPPSPLTAEQLQIRAAVASGKVSVGMTEQQVRSSWGEPTKTNVTTGSYGRHEQWIYDRGNFVSQYVYLQNGVVTGVQSPK